MDRAARAFPLGAPPRDRQPRSRGAADPLLLRPGPASAAPRDRPAGAGLADRAADPRGLGGGIVREARVLTLAPPNGERSLLLLAYVALGAIHVPAFALGIHP